MNAHTSGDGRKIMVQFSRDAVGAAWASALAGGKQAGNKSARRLVADVRDVPPLEHLPRTRWK